MATPYSPPPPNLPPPPSPPADPSVLTIPTITVVGNPGPNWGLVALSAVALVAVGVAFSMALHHAGRATA